MDIFIQEYIIKKILSHGHNFSKDSLHFQHKTFLEVNDVFWYLLQVKFYQTLKTTVLFS